MMKEWSDRETHPSDRGAWPVAIVLLGLQVFGLAALAHMLLR